MPNFIKLWSPNHSGSEILSESAEFASAHIDGQTSDVVPADLASIQYMLTELLNNAAQGNLSGRIPRIDDASPMAPMLHAFNRLFERMEGFVNELEIRMRAKREHLPPPLRG